MRWLTVPPDDQVGQAKKAEKIRAMDAFWAEFAREEGRLRHAGQAEADWLTGQVSKVDERIMFEVTNSDVSGQMEFALTPEGESHLRPMVAEFVRRAPQLRGWKFLEYRSALTGMELGDAVEARLGHEITAKGLDFNLDRGRVNLNYHFAGIGKPGDLQFQEALVLTELLVGEETLDVYTGSINAQVSIMPRPSVPLNRMAAEFARKKEELAFKCPPAPRFQTPFDDRTMAMVDLRASAQDSGLDIGFDDALVFTAEPIFLENRLTFSVFHSRLLSRFGEVFVYLQFDRPYGWQGQEADYRGHLEDQIDGMIAPNGVGAVVGGVHGMRMSSVHVAATQLWPCVDAMRAAGQAAGLGKRAWVLFHDATMGSEWVGVWPDSPEPRGVLR